MAKNDFQYLFEPGEVARIVGAEVFPNGIAADTLQFGLAKVMNRDGSVVELKSAEPTYRLKDGQFVLIASQSVVGSNTISYTSGDSKADASQITESMGTLEFRGRKVDGRVNLTFRVSKLDSTIARFIFNKMQDKKSNRKVLTKDEFMNSIASELKPYVNTDIIKYLHNNAKKEVAEVVGVITRGELSFLKDRGLEGVDTLLVIDRLREPAYSVTSKANNDKRSLRKYVKRILIGGVLGIFIFVGVPVIIATATDNCKIGELNLSNVLFWCPEETTTTMPNIDNLKIGYLADYSGSLDEFGPSIETGVQLAVEHLNAAGGVNGQTVEYVTGNTALDSTIAVREARRLINTEGVHAIVGPLVSGIVEAVAEGVTANAMIPIISPSATSPELSSVDDNGFLFRTVLSDGAQGGALANNLVEPAGENNVGVIYINNAYGQGLAEEFRANFNGTAELVSYDEDDTNFSDELQRVSERDALVVIGYDESANVVRAALQGNLFDTIFFVDGNRSADIATAVGVNSVEGFRGTAPSRGPTNTSRMAWESAYIARYGGLSNLQFAAEAYDAVIAIALAAEAASSVDGTAIRNQLINVATAGGRVVNPTVESLRAGLRAAATGQDVNYEGVSSSVEWNSVGDIISGYVTIWEFQNGIPRDIGQPIPFTLGNERSGSNMTPTPTPDPEPLGDFVHATFDSAAEITANIQNGTTLFRIDQQQPLQGYGAIMALALQTRYGITPASPLTLTGPGLVTLADIEGGKVPTRYPFGNDGRYPDLQTIRNMAADVDLIAIQHAECGYDSFWCIVQEGIIQAASDTGVDVDIRAPAQGQNAADVLPGLIRAAVAARPDGILLTFTYPDNADFVNAVKRAVDAGIPVVAYNAGSGPVEDGVDYLTVYNQDEYEAGKQAATRLIAAAEEANLSPVGICINHQVGNTSTDARCRGFVEVFNADSDARLATSNGVLQTTHDPSGSAQTITDFYAANGTTNVFLTMGPSSAGPFYTFLDDEALDDSSFVHGTFDTNDIIDQNIRDGVTLFGIDQQPFLQGYGAVTSLYLNWLFNAKPPSGRTLTGPGFVTTANIDVIPANAQGYLSARSNDVDLVVFDHGGPTNEWWETMRRTVELAAENLGVDYTTHTSMIGDNADSALNALQQLSANQGDGYVITLLSNNPSGAPWRTAVQRLIDQAPVVVYNAGTGPEDDQIPYATFVGQAEYQAGYIGGQAIAREVTRRNISNPLAACLNQGVGIKNLDDRCRGFADAMEEANIALVSNGGVVAINSYDVATTVQTLSDFYAANSGVNVFLTLGPDPARGFYQFLEDEGLK